MKKQKNDFVPFTTVTFVIGPSIETSERTTKILSQLKKVDKEKYQKIKKKNLEIESKGLEKIIDLD